MGKYPSIPESSLLRSRRLFSFDTSLSPNFLHCRLKGIVVKNRSRIIVVGMILASMICCGAIALADNVPLTFALSTASGTVNRLPLTLSAPVVSDQTKTTTLSGDISANLDFAIDSATHQLNSSGISGITFNKQTPAGHIAFTDLQYKWTVTIIVPITVQTVNMTGLKATAYTPVPPGSVTAVDATTFSFPVTNHALEINQGSIVWDGYEDGSQDCAASPISNLTLDSTGTLTFNRTADSLTSSSFSVGLSMPVNFSQEITTDVKVSTSGSTMAATATYTKFYTNPTAYWDTSSTAGLQAGHGTWSTASSGWSTSTAGSSPLYAWTADGGTVDAFFSASGASPIIVSGNVAAKSMKFNGAGYSFTGGTIAVNGGGITANQSATIGSALTLGAAQSWTAASGQTLTVSGNISAGANALTIKGDGAVSLGGVNNLAMVKVGDTTTPGNLNVTGGTTTIGNGLILGYGSAGSGTANLNGGTLSVGSISRSAGSTAATTFNFNGGTLKATASNTAFITGLTSAYVVEGGAKIDTQAFDITIGQSLLHGGIDPIDGGLTKNGSGKLTLTGAISYKGSTIINAGTLVLNNGLNSNLEAITGLGNLSIGPTSTLTATSIQVNTLSIGTIGSAMAVPEPGSLVLVAMAGMLGSLALLRRRR
jgi:autotransporter-associated beta strand protein